MSKKYGFKLNWRRVLGTLAIGIGAIAPLDIPATASPQGNSLQLAQVGVRTRIESPTPLNLRPRIHIPLPTINHHYNYPRHHYPRHHRRRGYYGGHEYYRNSHHPYYYRRGRSHKKKYYPSRRGKVIIINPGSHSSYGSQGSYIRIFGR